MNDQRNAHCFKAAPGKLGAMCGGGGGHGVAVDVGEVHSGLFKDAAVAQHPAATAAASFTLPAILNKGAAVYALKLLADIVLQLEQKGFHLLYVDGH